MSHRSQRVVDWSLVAIYPASSNGFKTCKVIVDYSSLCSMRALRGIRRLARVAVIGLVVAAVATELSKPEEERTWHGKVGGVVPYDFRPPTWERIRSAYWNPDSDRLFSDRVFGVGWAVNLYQAKRQLEAVFDRLMGTPPPLSIRMSTREPSASRSSSSPRDRD